MKSIVDVCSSAITLLGGEKIASLNEGSAAAEISSQLFQGIYESLLTEYRWRFAIRSKSLSKLTEPTDNNYAHKFQLPSDVLAVLNCTSNPYEIYQEELYTNSDDVSIEYIFTPKLDRLPPYFIKALEYRLAGEFAVPLTASEKKADLYFGLFENQMKKARHTDSVSRTTDTINSSPYISVRY